jgi:hypothetical protein
MGCANLTLGGDMKSCKTDQKKTCVTLRIGRVCSWKGEVFLLKLSTHRDVVELELFTNYASSDILAELDLPASGISRSEGRIALPKGVFTLNIPNEIRAPNTRMMFFYSAQIHLRKVLNRVHTDLYKGGSMLIDVHSIKRALLICLFDSLSDMTAPLQRMAHGSCHGESKKN